MQRFEVNTLVKTFFLKYSSENSFNTLTFFTYFFLLSCKEALLGFLSCITPYTQVQLLWKILGGNCHVAALQIVPGSSEAIAHRTCIVI